jgi:hypothetical protein
MKKNSFWKEQFDRVKYEANLKKILFLDEEHMQGELRSILDAKIEECFQ